MLAELAVRGDFVAALVAEKVVALEAARGGRSLLAAEAGDGDRRRRAGRPAGVILLVLIIIVGRVLTAGANRILEIAAGGQRPDVVGHCRRG